ncbi:hypothetical protein [Nocardia transvalensis]|uniref:hypothetical protein n=1 Tax=Nocardia transvalensis TaxID=37333 RepID=UPI0018956DBE|nr:hypothetical protein [Nocardia transvalensis]MBF6331888.1 hypothetical protein [Nocardia transvalensis]
MQITEQPTITAVAVTDEGYRARTLCLVDHHPADVILNVNITDPSWSRYRVGVFDPMTLEWRLVYHAHGTDYPPVPTHPHAAGTLEALQALAVQLRDTAEWIVSTARDLRPRG